MRKLLLVAFLIAAAPAFGADWVQVSKDDLSTIYMDPASLKRTPDGTLSIDALTDYDPASPKASEFRLSEKGLSEIESVLFDCANSKYSSQGGAWRDGHMGAGKVTKPYAPKEAWSKVPDYYEGLFAKVCQKP